MELRWPFWRTYKVKCPDGTTRTVYRDPDDAFPLSIREQNAKLATEIGVQELDLAKLSAEYASMVRGLLFSLDDFNRSLMMKFRAAYVVFVAHPCENSKFLETRISTIMDEQHRLQMISTGIRALVEYARIRPVDHELIIQTFQRLVDQLGGPVVALAAATEVSSTRELMEKCLKGGDEL